MRISDWSSDVCSSDLGTGTSHDDAWRRSGRPDDRQPVRGPGTGGSIAELCGPRDTASACGDAYDVAIRNASGCQTQGGSDHAPASPTGRAFVRGRSDERG